jgi:hypothetical protein
VAPCSETDPKSNKKTDDRGKRHPDKGDTEVATSFEVRSVMDLHPPEGHWQAE